MSWSVKQVESFPGIDLQGREMFGQDVRFAMRGQVVGVSVPYYSDEVFVEYRDGNWYVWHGDEPCANPPVSSRQEFIHHMMEAFAD